MELLQKKKTKLKIEPSYDPGIPLLGIYQKKKERKKTLILKYTCSSVFIADLFTKAKTETVSVHQLAIKKPWYTHTGL